MKSSTSGSFCHCRALEVSVINVSQFIKVESEQMLKTRKTLKWSISPPIRPGLI